MAEGFDNYMVFAVYDDVLVYTESCRFTYRLKKRKTTELSHMHACSHTYTHTQKKTATGISLIDLLLCISFVLTSVFRFC